MQSDEINQLLDRGFELVEAGNLAEARALFEQVSQKDPSNAEAWMMRGSVDAEMGNIDHALAELNQAIALDPSLPESFYYLATIYRAQGDHQAALEFIEKAMALDPEYGEAFLLGGAICGALGVLEQAVQYFFKATQLQPDLVDAWAMLGRTCAQLGDTGNSAKAYQNVLNLKPDSEEAYYGLGFASYQQGRMEDAITYYGRALEINPAYTSASNSLGTIYQLSGKYQEALSTFDRALVLKTDSPEALFGKARALIELGRQAEAMPLLRQALQIKPDYIEAGLNLAATLMTFDKPDEAMQCCTRVLELQPDCIDAVALAARIELQVGQTEAAYQRLKPFVESGIPHANLAIAYGDICRSLNRPGEAVGVLESLLLNDDALSVVSRRNVRFCLGSLYDKMKDFDKAFSHYSAGNELRGISWDPEVNRTQIDNIINVFSKDFLAHAPRNETHSEKPVFVLGMPRSGTSLVEQILASHPAVYGAGELTDLYNLAGKLPALLGTDLKYPACMTQVDADTLSTLADSYLAHLDELAPDALRVVDKMPGNFSFIGFIELLFPGARIIHCRRDPLDTCLSCFFQDFAMSQPHSYNLEHLGSFYRDYERLMAHWKSVVTLPILDVSYEDLVQDQETVSRQLVEFCGLDWDARCLNFHETKRFVATSSYDQVRRPLYSSSVKRWEHYKKHLDLLRDALQ